MFSRSARLYDAIYSFKDYAEEAAKIRSLIEVRVSGARTLLDVGCGTGGHLVHFARWYEAEGLDLDPDLLALARSKLPDLALHEGDMTTMDLGRRYQAVVCLFSSIGYVRTETGLDTAIAGMAQHLDPGGVMIVEPWLTPDAYEPDYIGSLLVDEPDLKIARFNTNEVRDGTSVMHFHYLVTKDDGSEHFSEEHILGLWTVERHLKAFAKAGLQAEHDSEGIFGRGLYVAVR